MVPTHGAEHEALRIQAAAVAAQQAALIEEEARLQQRRLVLEQQEEQLAGHLEEKRGQLLELQKQVQAERLALRTERTTYMRQVGLTTRQLEADRADIAAAQQQCQTRRARLKRLHDRLRQRWRRHWAAEQEGLQQRARRLEDQARRLEKERQRLDRDREALHQQRLRWNGEHELDRRELQAGWQLLKEEQRHWQEQQAQERAQWRDYVSQLEEREANFAAEQRHWEGRRQVLKKEAEGLETRIANHRRKIQEQEQEVVRLSSALQELQARVTSSTPIVPPELPRVEIPVPSILSKEWLEEVETALRTRLAELDALAGDLADQRLHLSEQCHRLMQAQERWQEDRKAVAGELEALGRQLQEREQALELAEARCRQREDEVDQQRRRLDSWQAQLTARMASWEGERERLLADLRGREDLLAKSLATVANVRRQWQQRHQQGVDRLRAEYAACENLRQEYTLLRQDWQRQHAALGEQQRQLAQQIVALEQFRQQVLRQVSNPAAAAKKLERLRRRGAALAAAAERQLAQDRQALEEEASRLEERFHQVRDLLEEINVREADLSTREVAWEHDRVQANLTAAKLRQDVDALQAQRAIYEQQVNDLNEEVERLARVLMDEGDAGPLPLTQAA